MHAYKTSQAVDETAIHELPALTESEILELAFWRNSELEGPGCDTFDNLVNKLTDVPVLMNAIALHRDQFSRARRILELGAGQGWAACLIKRMVRDRGGVVTASDISGDALASLSIWERTFGVRLDRSFACRSYELPVADRSIDLVYTFAAAHHFRAHRRTLQEVFRVLAPGGVCLYLHEPTCRQFIYPMAHRRVNLKRPEVHEDVIVYPRLMALARSLGFAASAMSDVSLEKRGTVELLYYATLRAIPALQSLLPCTRHLAFRKPLA